MRKTEVVAAVINGPESFFMQRRDGAQQRGALGLLGFWGGKLEKGETIKECAARKVAEETTLFPKPYNFGYDRHINPLEIPEDYTHFGYIKRKGLLIAHAVTLRVVSEPQFSAKEGILEVLTRSQVKRAMNFEQLTPVATAYFRRNPDELIDN